MKIVRIIARLNVGGPARHVVWLNSSMQNDGFNSVLLTGKVPEGEEDMSYFAEEHGVKPIIIKEMSRELSLKDFVSLWKVYKILWVEKPDIIHTHTAKAGTIGRVAGFFYRWLTFRSLVGKPRKVKIIHTFHGHIFHSYYGNLKTKLFLFIEKCLAKLATNKIIVISKQQKKEIHSDFGIGKTDQFQIIPLGIDLEKFKDSKEKNALLRKEIGAEEELIVGLVGRLTEIKNHKLFLSVIEKYKKANISNKPELKFVIIGDGHLRKNLEKKAKEAGIENLVSFLGNRNDAAVFYAGLDIVALTSLNEGTPLSLIEAMANEKPVISTSVGGVVDLLGDVANEKDGVLYCERGARVTSGGSESFFQGLCILANNTKLQNDLGQKGLEFVKKNYSKKRLVDDISALYRTIN